MFRDQWSRSSEVRGCVQWQLIQARLTDCDRSGHAEKKTAPAPLVVGGLHTGAVSFAIPRQIRAYHPDHAIIPDHCHLFLETVDRVPFA